MYRHEIVVYNNAYFHAKLRIPQSLQAEQHTKNILNEKLIKEQVHMQLSLGNKTPLYTHQIQLSVVIKENTTSTSKSNRIPPKKKRQQTAFHGWHLPLLEGGLW